MSKNIDELREIRNKVIAVATALSMSASSAALADNGLYAQEFMFTPIVADNDASNDNITTSISFESLVEQALNVMTSFSSWDGDIKREIECLTSITGRVQLKASSLEMLKNNGIIFANEKYNKEMALNAINRLNFNNETVIFTADSPSELDVKQLINPSLFIYSEVGKEVSDAIFSNLINCILETMATKNGCGKVIVKPDLCRILLDSNSYFNRVHRQLTASIATEANVYGVKSNERWYLWKADGVPFLDNIIEIIIDNIPENIRLPYIDIDRNHQATLKPKAYEVRNKRICVGPDGKISDEDLLILLLQKYMSVYEVVYTNSENEINTELNINDCDNKGVAIYDGNVIAISGGSDGKRLLFAERLDGVYELAGNRRKA